MALWANCKTNFSVMSRAIPSRKFSYNSISCSLSLSRFYQDGPCHSFVVSSVYLLSPVFIFFQSWPHSRTLDSISNFLLSISTQMSKKHLNYVSKPEA